VYDDAKTHINAAKHCTEAVRFILNLIDLEDWDRMMIRMNSQARTPSASIMTFIFVVPAFVSNFLLFITWFIPRYQAAFLQILLVSILFNVWGVTLIWKYSQIGSQYAEAVQALEHRFWTRSETYRKSTFLCGGSQ